MTVPDVNRVLDLKAAQLFGAEGLGRAMLFEAERLGHLKQLLWRAGHAIAGMAFFAARRLVFTQRLRFCPKRKIRRKIRASRRTVQPDVAIRTFGCVGRLI